MNTTRIGCLVIHVFTKPTATIQVPVPSLHARTTAWAAARASTHRSGGTEREAIQMEEPNAWWYSELKAATSRLVSAGYGGRLVPLPQPARTEIPPSIKHTAAWAARTVRWRPILRGFNRSYWPTANAGSRAAGHGPCTALYRSRAGSGNNRYPSNTRLTWSYLEV